jgi:hypothetical protein
MNWRRGLLRLWIAGSLCWVSLVGWTALVSEHDRALRNAADERCMARKKQEGSNPFDCFDKPSNLFDNLPKSIEWLIKHYALWAFSPPLALLTVGLTGAWIFAGFARDRRS